ncbi:MAG: hypothetical protein ABI539_13635 [Acidobacteriota bacterium]
MGSTKHEKSFVDFDKPYEQNVIGLKGIVYFGIGLFILIVITFALMFALLNVLEDNAEPTMSSSNPMAMTDRERLPPEPRLQSAPGFGVDSSAGRVNMELGAPQAEYQELHRQWVETWKNGNKDAKTGAITSLPIDRAKEIFLGQAVKARSGPDAEKSATESRMFISDSSAGRTATIRRR